MAEAAGDFSIERSYCMEITWKLRDFLQIQGNRLSPSFSLAKSNWNIELIPNGSGASSRRFVSIYLKRLSYSVAQQRVGTTFSLKYRDGKNCRCYNFDTSYDQKYYSWGIQYFIPRWQMEEEKHSLLPDGTLTVHCQIRVEPSSDDRGASEEESTETDSTTEGVGTVALSREHLDASSLSDSPDACKGTGDLARTSPSVPKLQLDYRKLLESEEETDVCLKVADKEFRAHKCILRARSSVFSATFKHDMEEKNSGEVVIEDLDPESFPEFLQYVYAGRVDNLSGENVFNLYTAADKYDMADLKSECEGYMERNLSADIFCDVMILALRYKDDELLKVASDFFCKNLTKVIVTPEWQKFLKEYSTESSELLIKALIPSEGN